MANVLQGLRFRVSASGRGPLGSIIFLWGRILGCFGSSGFGLLMSSLVSAWHWSESNIATMGTSFRASILYGRSIVTNIILGVLNYSIMAPP